MKGQHRFRFPRRWQAVKERMGIGHFARCCNRMLRLVSSWLSAMSLSALRMDSVASSVKALDRSRSFWLFLKSSLVDSCIAGPPLWLGFGLPVLRPRKDKLKR